jgi:6-phosphogluconolactonase/glucosamine-6-phosphate isomerase/deaminase
LAEYYGVEEEISMTAVKTVRYDEMQVNIYESSEALGTAAAEDLAEILCSTIAECGEGAIIVATGNSQLFLMKALQAKRGIPWNKVTLFHMDEYVPPREFESLFWP